MLYKTLLIFLTVLFFNGGSSIVDDNSIGESTSGYLTSLPPQIPKLVSPKNSESVLSDTVCLIWNKQIHTSSFKVELAETMEFEDILFENHIQDTSILLTTLEADKEYYWRVNSKNVAGESEYSEIYNFLLKSPTGLEDISYENTKEFRVISAYPNPFNDKIKIVYFNPKRSNIVISIYGENGIKIKDLFSGIIDKGKHNVSWAAINDSGEKLSRGLYTCSFVTEEKSISKKIIYLNQ